MMLFKQAYKRHNKNSYKGKLLYFFYNLLWLLILLPASMLILWRYRKYTSHSARFGERLALSSKLIEKQIWLHTASVGEVNAALPLLNELIKGHTANSILVTTTTPTGEQILQKAFGGSVDHAYLPFDQSLLMKRFLSRVKPQTIILFETEVWPSLIVEAKKNNSRVILVNARMSEKSKDKYLRYRSFATFIFGQLSLIVAQTKEDASRFAKLGVLNCDVSGSLKYSVTIDKALVQASIATKNKWLSAIGNKKIIIAASTHPTEEELILEAVARLKRLNINPLLILVPRHVERAGEVETFCVERSLAVSRFDNDKLPNNNADIILVDVVGSLFALFGIADVAIMGGTFIPRGGHNFLEPAAWGLPIVSGKSDYNFTEIAKGLKSNGGLTQVDSIEPLVDALKKLLLDDAFAKEQGNNAKIYSQKNANVVNKMLSIIEPLLPEQKPDSF